MSSPAAAPPHLSQKPSPGRPLEGLGGIITFIVVAGILVAGPRIWTLGEFLGGLRGSPPGDASQPLPSHAKGARPSAATRSLKAPAIGEPATPVRATPAPSPAGPQPAGAPPRRKVAVKVRPAATPRPAAARPVQPPAAGDVRLERYYHAMEEGVRLYRGGWFGPSVGRFRQAAALLPSSPYAYLWLGRATIAAHRTDEARRALQRVIALAPDSQAAYEAANLLKQLSAGSI